MADVIGASWWNGDGIGILMNIPVNSALWEPFNYVGGHVPACVDAEGNQYFYFADHVVRWNVLIEAYECHPAFGSVGSRNLYLQFGALDEPYN